MANLVAGQIDHWWRVSLGLSRCELWQKLQLSAANQDGDLGLIPLGHGGVQVP
jgi:hypothetical protein